MLNPSVSDRHGENDTDSLSRLDPFTKTTGASGIIVISSSEWQ